MSKKTSCIKVNMLGGFQAEYNGSPVSVGRRTTNVMKLFLPLLYYHKDGIERTRLVNMIFGFDELSDTGNSLRVTAHRLKTALAQNGIEGKDCILIEKGFYKWTPDIAVELDTEIFMRLGKKAEKEENPDKRFEYLKKACFMYKGEFLPELSSEVWVVTENVNFKGAYAYVVGEACNYLMERERYEEAIEIVEPACKLYPFDEWQSVKIECLIALGKYKEALQEYEETSAYLFDELGVRPSERMIEQFKRMSDLMGGAANDIDNIIEEMREEYTNTGAYFCNYPSFRDSYRLMRRIVERSGQSVYMMACTIVGTQGNPMQDEKRLAELSHALYRAIGSSLRKGDSYTRYNPSQYLIMLIDTKREDCKIIEDRIRSNFAKGHDVWKRYLKFNVASIAEMPTSGKVSIRDFEKKEVRW